MPFGGCCRLMQGKGDSGRLGEAEGGAWAGGDKEAEGLKPIWLETARGAGASVQEPQAQSNYKFT